jgi:hypothetical protein
MRQHYLLRGRDDRGVALVIFALSLTAIVALAGLCVDGGRLYAARRQMQNAADASAMAAARALDRYQTGQSTHVTAVWNAAQSEASADGAAIGPYLTCRLLDFNRKDVGVCPTVSSVSIPKAAAAVRVSTEVTQGTFFMQAGGLTDFTASASAVAVIGKPMAGNAPFMVCANAPGVVPPIMTNPSGANPPMWAINTQAIGTTYDVYGNSIKKLGRDCGDPSSAFRGLVDDNSGPFSIPGWWAALTGNKTGPTKAMINSGDVCQGSFDDTSSSAFNDGCKVILPLCTKGNNKPGNAFQAYCIDLGVFQIVSNENHDVTAKFLGRATITTGAIGGPADVNGARIIQLEE